MLYRHGRLARTSVLRSFAAAVLPCRVLSADLARLPPWIAEGAFFTWISPRSFEQETRARSANIVDVCANANVASLLAMIGAPHFPGYESAIQTVLAGVAWAGRDRARLDALTPFYPSPRCLLEAIDHAVECGAKPLQAAAKQLRALGSAMLDTQPGLCRDAYGRTVWHAEVIDLAGDHGGKVIESWR